MNRRLVSCLAASIAAGFAGCAAPSTTGENPAAIRSSDGAAGTASTTSIPVAPSIVAAVDDSVVTSDELNAALRENYGVDLMLKLIQLRMAENAAQNESVKIADSDVDDEILLTMQQLFPNLTDNELPDLMTQVEKQFGVTPLEFRMVMRTNAILRAVVRHRLEPRITEDQIREHFNAMYGERVQVQHMALDTYEEARIAKNRVAKGEDFAVVAHEMSQSPRAVDLPPFPRNAQIGSAITQAAFALEAGQVSDPISQDNLFHLIKLIKRIPPDPNVVKFEDHRDAVKRDLEIQLSNEPMLTLRQNMARRALEAIVIRDDKIRAEYEQRKADARAKVKSKEQVLSDPGMQHPTTMPGAATLPSTTTQPAPTTAP